ncbi:MAG: AI-2E family transporter [Acidobacteria bacterium]|nr:AI-2E family transporter [Bryobacteraceae bacterium CoA2 C42]
MIRHQGSLVFLAAALIVLLPFLWQVARPFLHSFILAAVLSIVIYPVQEWLSLRIGRPGLATLITTLGTVLIVGSILLVVGLTITNELTAAYSALSQRSLEEGGWPALVSHTADRAIDAMAAYLPVNYLSTNVLFNKDAIRAELIDRMKDASGYLLTNIGAAVGGVTNLLITALLVTIFLHFLLRYGRQWIGQLSVLTPIDAHSSASLVRTIHDSVLANVIGLFAAAVAQGLLLGLGFWFVGLRTPWLWGAVGGLASIIPIVGAPIVWLPVVVGFALGGAYGKALGLGLWGSLVVGSVDNLLRPFVVGTRDKHHPMLIALAAGGGTYAFGPLGILLGPLLVSLSAALLKEIQALVSFAEIVASYGEHEDSLEN